MRIGIIGGGQLGRMIALAGYPLGHDFRFLEPKPGAPVSGLGEVVRADYDEEAALREFGDGLDLVTYEFENVPVESARLLAARLPVFPPPAALEMAQDRLVEKDSFRELGIPTAPYLPVDSRGRLREALEEIGTPAVLKTRRWGYDGRGQVVLEAPDDAKDAWTTLGDRGGLILEGFVEFRRELSVLAVRGREGATAFYPLVENRHEDGILRSSLAPASSVPATLQAEAEGYATRVLEHLDYVGVLAIELFQVDDRLLANEMAPRVHNSGHWTQDGASHSQFESHVRACCGHPLASTRATGHSAMVNLLGRVPDIDDLLAIPEAHLHLYDKAPRPGRKLGHVNLVGEDAHEVRRGLAALRKVAGEGIEGSRSATTSRV